MIKFQLLIFVLSLCACTPEGPGYKLNLYTLEEVEGGLSGLAIDSSSAEDVLVLWSHTDRGPNASEIMDKEVMKRPFLKPLQHPYWIKFSINTKTKEVKILEKIDLPLSGLPNVEGDELPLDQFGNIIPRDFNGIDPEGICIMNDTVWMSEEYRPSILKFDFNGKFLKRFVPKNSFSDEELAQNPLKDSISQVLPEKYRERRLNRGFEGIACGAGKVYSILQSPINGDAKNTVRLLEFDTKAEKVTREFFYQFSEKAEKIGDLYLQGEDFYAIEQNSETGPKSIHKIFRFRLENADSQGGLKTELVLDLVKEGYDFADKVEGLAVLGNGHIVIINDNDFGLTGDWNAKSGKATIDKSRKTILGIVQ